MSAGTLIITTTLQKDFVAPVDSQRCVTVCEGLLHLLALIGMKTNK